jgi:hypothetical protein
MANKETKIVYRTWNPLNLVAMVFAIMVSWFYNHSVLWAIFHGMFSWIYLIYSLIIGRFAHGGFMNIINHYFN